jgi:hypothetical protein
VQAVDSAYRNFYCLAATRMLKGKRLFSRLAAMPLGSAVRLRLTTLASQELEASPLALFFEA